MRASLLSKDSPAKFARADRVLQVLLGAGCLLILYLIITHAVANRRLSEGDAAAALASRSDLAAASAAEASAAFYRGDYTSAKALAMSSIADAPARPAGATILALTLQQAGNLATSRRLMDQVSSMGWRDPSAQLWLLRRDLSEGQYDNAALRSDALLRQRLYEEEAIAGLKQIAAGRGGLERVAERLASNPIWRGSFFAQNIKRGGGDLNHVVQLMERLRGTNAPATAAELRPLLNTLVSAGRVGEAHRLWGALRLEKPPSIASATAEQDASAPFAWQYRSLPGVTISAPGVGEDHLRVSAEGTVSGRLVEKLLFLRPHQYQLSTAISEDTKGNAASFRWEVRCVAGNTLLLQTKGLKAGETTHPFQVPASCEASRLTLFVDHEGPQPTGIGVKEPSLMLVQG